MTFDIIMLWLHLLSAVVWIGGMIFNLFLVRPSLGIVEGGDRIKLALSILRRFVPLVWLSVLLLSVSGVYFAAMRIDSIDIIIASAYGRILLSKVIILVTMASIVAYIRYNRLPIIESLIGTPEMGRVLGRVVSLVKLNIALGISVLFLSSIMASL